MNVKLLTMSLPLVLYIQVARAQTSLPEQDRERAVKYLEQTRDDLSSTLAGLTEAQMNFKPEANKWSVKECVEHITLAEVGLSQLLASSLKAPADPMKRKEITVNDDDVIARLTNRSGKATSPDFLKPTGNFKTVQQSLEVFLDQRKKSIEYVETTTDDLRNHFGSHPVTGTIDCYQLILLMAAHQKRHTMQIEEIKANINFPKS